MLNSIKTNGLSGMKKKIILALAASLAYADAAPDLVTIQKIAQNASQVMNTLNNASLGLYSVISHSEIQYGHGRLAFNGSLFGFDTTISNDLTTYNILQQHQNTPIDHLNYNYKISYYTSKLQSPVGKYLPQTNIAIKGIDADIGVGWNIVDISDDEYISIGLDVGVSVPNIDTSQASNSTYSSPDNNASSPFSIGNIKLTTYKIGPQIRFSKILMPMFAIYGSAVYAKEYATISAQKLHTKVNASGTFHEEELGIRFHPIDYKYKVTSWFTIHPNLYFSAGIRYSQWQLKNVNLNISNYGVNVLNHDLTLSSYVTFVGMGYSF